MIPAINKEKSFRVIFIIFFIVFLGITASMHATAQDAQTFYENGYQFFSKGNYKEAEESYQKAIDLDSNFEDAYYWLGKVYRQTGQYDNAITQWIEVLRINPRNPYAFRYLNESYRSTSRVQGTNGIDYFNMGIEMLDIDNEIFLNESSYSTQALLQTVPYFKRAIELKNDLTAAHYWLGEVYYALSKRVSWQYTSMAISSFENAIKTEEEKNQNTFQKPSEYWHSYHELLTIFQSLGLNERKENLLKQLTEKKKMPYKEILVEGGYPDLEYPDQIEIFSDGEEVTELWIFVQEGIKLRVVDKKIVGEEINNNISNMPEDAIMNAENMTEGEIMDEDQQ